MPTENRSANAPFQREERYVVIKISKMHPHPHFRAMHLKALKREHEDALVECLVIERDWPEYEPAWAAIEARMTGKPVDQHRGEPVAWRGINDLGEVVTEWIDGVPPESMVDLCGNPASFAKIEQAYTHADPGEVERLRSIERSHRLRDALLEQVKGERDRMIARTMELAAQLADQDALLHKLKETLQREYWDEHAGLDETRELIDAALSATPQPSRPAAPYPNRLCHIDYTAHPYRCGCLRGDEESQRIYDEHCRSAEPEAKS